MMIMNDIWPSPLFTREEPIDYGALDTSLRKMCVKGGLKDVEGTGNPALLTNCLKNKCETLKSARVASRNFTWKIIPRC